jgi:hypothetical protein
MNVPDARPNPFAQQVVTGPGDALDTAESIHQPQFAEILRIFGSLQAAVAPRLVAGPPVQLVLSRDPGCGKSHLLVRLSRALSGRAVVVYLRAHQDKSGFWQRILERLLQELEHRKVPGPSGQGADAPTQLDELARHLLANLILEAVKNGKINNREPQKAAAAIVEGKPAALAKLKTELPKLLGILTGLLQDKVRAANLHLDRELEAWLKVLACYTLNAADGSLRTLAIDWMQGCYLETGEYERLGLTRRQSSGDLAPRPEDVAPAESALKCVKLLCVLAAFFRPVVFAFDQTEIYGQAPELASAFGVAVERLWSECVNKFVIVTANEQPWFSGVWARFQQADRARFDSAPIRIDGITREQADELVRVKMRGAAYPPDSIETFLRQPFFARLYPDGQGLRPPREVEREASAALSRRDGPVAPGLASEDTERRLRTAFDEHRQRILRTPADIEFDVGVLQWVLTAGLAGLAGARPDAAFHSSRGYLNARWEAGGLTVLFVLNISANWNRWRAIVREYGDCAERERARGRSVRGIVLRHRSLRPFGDGVRSLLGSPEARGIAVIYLSDAEMAELYAAQAVFADICQGDLERIDQSALIAFLGRRLYGWLLRFCGTAVAADEAPAARPSPASPAPPAIAPILEQVIREAGMLSWPVLRTRLEERGFGVSLEQVLQQSKSLADRVKVLSTPTNHVFIWQARSI